MYGIFMGEHAYVCMSVCACVYMPVSMEARS